MNLFTIDTHVVAVSVGLPSSRINQVMQSTFFELSQEMAKQGRERQLDAAVDRMYGEKHPKIVTSNKQLYILFLRILTRWTARHRGCLQWRLRSGEALPVRAF